MRMCPPGQPMVLLHAGASRTCRQYLYRFKVIAVSDTNAHHALEGDGECGVRKERRDERDEVCLPSIPLLFPAGEEGTRAQIVRARRFLNAAQRRLQRYCATSRVLAVHCSLSPFPRLHAFARRCSFLPAQHVTRARSVQHRSLFLWKRNCDRKHFHYCSATAHPSVRLSARRVSWSE